MSARERILAKLRASEKFAERVEPDVASWFAGHRRVESGAEKADRFRQCIELAHAEVYNVNRGSWLQKLWEVLAATEIIDRAAGKIQYALAQGILPGRPDWCGAHACPRTHHVVFGLGSLAMESHRILNSNVNCAALCRSCSGRRVVVSGIHFSTPHRWSRPMASSIDIGRVFLAHTFE